jgi:Mrp family chromosome partitioning ATPase
MRGVDPVAFPGDAVQGSRHRARFHHRRRAHSGRHGDTRARPRYRYADSQSRPQSMSRHTGPVARGKAAPRVRDGAARPIPLAESVHDSPSPKAGAKKVLALRFVLRVETACYFVIAFSEIELRHRHGRWGDARHKLHFGSRIRLSCGDVSRFTLGCEPPCIGGHQMGKVIVVTSGKGGVGKTTSTAALGAALAREERMSPSSISTSACAISTS